jgi:transcriptional regulator with XRE-family HTH domain
LAHFGVFLFLFYIHKCKTIYFQIPNLKTVLMTKIEKNIRELAEKRGFTLKEVAKRGKMGESTIYNVFKTGGGHPRTLERIANVLGVDPVELSFSEAPKVLEQKKTPLPPALASDTLLEAKNEQIRDLRKQVEFLQGILLERFSRLDSLLGKGEEPGHPVGEVVVMLPGFGRLAA